MVGWLYGYMVNPVEAVHWIIRKLINLPFG